MREVKNESKSQNSANLFEGTKSDHNATLSFANSRQILELEKSGDIKSKRKSFISILKQLFLFLPGTFLLFYMSFGAAVIFLEIVVFRREIQTLPADFPLQFALIGLVVLVGALMTWVGLGDITNKKHFAIPASLMITGATLGVVTKVAASFSNLADRMLDDFTYLVYLFPLALITPILAKAIVDRESADATKD